MTSTDSGEFEDIEERPSWFLPLCLFIITAIFALLIYWYYLGYTIDDLTGNTISGTERGRVLQVAIGGHRLEIPANYTQYPKDRRDGPRDTLELFTVLPDFVPFSRRRRRDFLNEAADSTVIIFKLSAQNVALTESQRVEQYLKSLVVGDGIDTDLGLIEFQFDADSAFHDQDMFVFRTTTGLHGMIRCLRRSETIQAPFCWRETEIGDGLTLHYRFKRAHLAEWQTIDRNILDMVEQFTRIDAPSTVLSENF